MPALVGGTFIGVLSALPLVSLGNLCCCLWVVGGGVVAAFLMQQSHPEPIDVLDGGAAGFLSGVVGAFVFVVASLPLGVLLGSMQRDLARRLLSGAQDIPEEMRTAVEQLGTGTGGLVIGFLIMLVVGSLFATVGGIVGAAIFRRPTASPPSLPPRQSAPPPLA